SNSANVELPGSRSQLMHDPFSSITVTRIKDQERKPRPLSFAGESILPIEGYDPITDIHMVLDNGAWRLARN
ncbi:MAG: hypothetical protein ACREEE_16965, partial [Dongiaceae bacterium]